MSEDTKPGRDWTVFLMAIVLCFILSVPVIGVTGSNGKDAAMELNTVLGPTDEFTGTVNLATDVMEQYVFGEVTLDGMGYAVKKIDLNGDKKEDLLVTAPGFNNTRGAVFVFLGGLKERRVDFRDAELVLEGQIEGEFLGLDVDIGDVNGDGVMDILASGYMDHYAYPQAAKKYYPRVFLFLGGTPWRKSIPSTEADSIFIGSGPQYGFGWDVELGDINNDNYDDVVVSEYRMGPTWTSPTYYEGRVFIWEGKLAMQPVYNVSLAQYDHRIYTSDNTYTSGKGYWGIGSSDLDLADINGDGYSDVIIGSDRMISNGLNSGEVEVIFGSSSLPVDMDLGSYYMPYPHVKVISYENYGLSLVSHADFNGDGIMDLIVDAPYGFYDRKGGIFIFYGDQLFATGPLYLTEYDFLIRGPSTNWGIGVKGIEDVDQDGRDDLFIFSDTGELADLFGCYYILHSSETDDLVENVYMMQFETPAFKIKGPEKTIGFGYNRMDEVELMDLNDDGLLEIAISAPRGTFDKHPAQIGVVYLYYQTDYVMTVEDFKILDADGPNGNILGAGKVYHFQGYAVNTWDIDDFRLIEIYFNLHGIGVDGKSIVLFWDRGLMQISEKSDPDGYVEINSSTITIIGESGMNIEFELIFNPNIPSEEAMDMNVVLASKNEQSAMLSYPSIFKVEPDVEFFGELQVTGDVNGPLSKGTHVRAKERIKISGLKPVYQGTEASPPNSYYKIKMTDNFGNVFIDSTSSGRMIDFTVLTHEISGREEVNLSFIDLVGEADNLAGLVTFFYIVDIDLPPPPDDVEIRADSDIDTLIGYDNDPEVWVTWLPALDPSSEVIGYLYSFEDGGGTTAGTFTPNTVVKVEIPEKGWNTLYVWTVDAAHNYGPSTASSVYYDTDAPEFGTPNPASGSWVNSNMVNYELAISDSEGSGVKGSTIEYCTSFDGGQTYTAWEPTNIRREGEKITVKLFMNFREGKDNYIKWRAKDIAGNGYVVSDPFQVKVDTVPLSYKLPTPDKPVEENYVVCGITLADTGSGIDSRTIEYSISHNGVSNYGPWETLDLSGTFDSITVETPPIYFEMGTLNYIKWRAKDLAGNGYTYSTDIPLDILPEKINHEPVPIITDPAEDKKYLESKVITFDGSTSWDRDNDELEFLWYSDKDGYLGTDAVIERKLSQNKHLITLHVSDGKANNSISIEITVIPDITALDSDSDGIPDFNDVDDDNDGLLDIEEDLNKNGLIDGNETDPKNPDTDNDGVNDFKDPAPRDPTIYKLMVEDKIPWWVPLIIVLAIILALVVVGVMFLLKQRTDKQAMDARRSLRRTRRNLRRFEVLTGVPTNDLPAIEAVQWALPGVINEASEFVLAPPSSEDMLPPKAEEGPSVEEPKKPDLKDMEVPAPVSTEPPKMPEGIPEPPKGPEPPAPPEPAKPQAKGKVVNCTLCGSEVVIPEGATSSECPLCGEMINI